MSRINLEDNLARRVRHASMMFSTVETAMVGVHRIAKDGPQFHFLTTGTVNRDCYLPPIEPGAGQFYVVSNQGPTGTLTIHDDSGAALKTVDPNASMFCVSSNQFWHILPLSDSGATPVVSTDLPVDALKLAGFKDSTGLVLRGVGVSAGLSMAGAPPGTILTLDPDLQSLAAISATDVLVYRSAPNTWATVTIGANLTFSNGILTATGGATGNVNSVGVPVNLQLAQWTDATHIQGINPSSLPFQPLDADLTSIAAAAGTNTIYYRSAAGTWSPVTIGATMTFVAGTLNTTAGGGNVIASGTPLNGQWARWTSAATIEGVDATATGFQPLDGDLTSLAAATAVDAIYYRSAINTWATVSIGANLTFSGGTLSATGGAAGAPIGAEYITSVSDPTLTAERVLTDTATVTWDRTTTGQIKANAAPAGAPLSAEYITSTSDATLSAERVLTDTATVTWDRSVAGQIKANAAGGGGGATLTIADTPPASPTSGSLWWESDTGTLWLYYNDGTSSQWVATNGAGTQVVVTQVATQTITSSSAYVPTAGTKFALFEMVAGGGGGGGISQSTSGSIYQGGGGGAGSYARAMLSAATIALGVSITVATGGGAGAAGGNGGPGSTGAITGVSATISISSPAVVTQTNHGLRAGQSIYLATSGALPTGLAVNTRYFVMSTGLTANTFQLSATVGGAAINTSGTQSGTHTIGFVTVLGGGGGGGSTNGGTFPVGGAGGVATVGDFISPGAPGCFGTYATIATVVAFNGAGAPSYFGGGAIAALAGSGSGANGIASGGFGGGGSGGVINNSTGNQTGGAGAPGVCVITEYI